MNISKWVVLQHQKYFDECGKIKWISRPRQIKIDDKMMNSIEKRDVKKQLIHGIYRVCKHLFLKETLKKKIGCTVTGINCMRWRKIAPFKYIFLEIKWECCNGIVIGLIKQWRKGWLFSTSHSALPSKSRWCK